MSKLFLAGAVMLALTVSLASAGEVPAPIHAKSKVGGFPMTTTFVSGTKKAGGGTASVEIKGDCSGLCSGTVTWRYDQHQVCVKYEELWPQASTKCF